MGLENMVAMVLASSKDLSFAYAIGLGWGFCQCALLKCDMNSISPQYF